MSKRRPGLEYRHGSPADGAVPGRVSDPAGARVAGAGLALPLAGLLLCLPVLGLVLGLGACAAEPSGGRVLVLGLDGMDPGTIDLLISEGKLPNFERLRKEGAYAPLESRVPLMSPVIWTTVATGMTPDVHGIGAFVAVNEKTGDRMPVTSQMRQVKALWTLATEAGLSSAVVGWWATWPAETVRGSIVSDHLCYHFLFERALEEDSSSLGLTHPEALQEELQSQVIRPDDISYEEARRFVDVSPDEFDRPFDYYDDLSHFRWALATARTHAGIGLDLWRRERPELAMVYIEGTDSTSHLFGHLFRADGLQGDLAEQHRRYGRTVEEIYGFADDLVGEYMAAMDEETTLVILSDHGFRLGELLSDPTKIEDLRRVRTNQHSLHGILYMAGRHVLPGTGLDDPSIMDIAPTLLALLGLPASEEMPGRVLTEALTLDPPARVPSYETGEPGESRLARDSRVDPQILARLESLGYLDTTAPRSDRVLAGAMFSEGKLEEALARYRKLLLEQPDSPGLHVSVAGTLGQLGRYDEADEHLALALSINPLSSPAYHNRGVIAERRGNTAQAIRDYRTALRYKPDYDPSREALIRLVGTAEPPPPETEAGREADRLAAEAAEAAKRGAFETAMSLLDEAQEIAPDHAILYQYRSNVAYLMGDREGAIRALEMGLELEPDNALFSENLRTLKEQARETPQP